MNPLAQAISLALIHFLWQGTIAGLLLWTVLYSLRKKPANARYIAACAVLGVMAVLPVLTAGLLYFRPGSTHIVHGTAVDVRQITASAVAALDIAQPAWLALLQQWALPVWCAGVLLFSLRLVVGYQHVFQLTRRGQPAGDALMSVVSRLIRSMGVGRRVRVLISPLSDTPGVVGWIRPVVMLPAATLMGLTPLQLEAVLAHELGHIKRYDYLVNMFQMTVETLLFYHPAVWWASRRIRVERELCCDDLAVQFSGSSLRYAKALITLEKMRLKPPVVAMASTGGPLLYRIQRLAGVTPREYGSSRLPAIFAAALGAMCIVLSVTWVRGQDAPGVKVDLGSAAILHRTPVPFPPEIQQQGITGTVQLELTLDDGGNVADAHVLSGPQELRKTSLESVLNWHFTKDAGRGTRLVTISYSNNAKQVQISEPPSSAPATTWTRAFVNMADSDNVPVTIGLTRRQQLERQIQDVKKQASVAEYSGVPESERAALKLRMAELVRALNATPFEGRENPRTVKMTEVAGRPVKTIAAFGLAEAARADLLSRLPVRVGDILTPESLEATRKAVRDYDEHLAVSVVSTVDGQAEIRIGLNEAKRAEGVPGEVRR